VTALLLLVLVLLVDVAEVLLDGELGSELRRRRRRLPGGDLGRNPRRCRCWDGYAPSRCCAVVVAASAAPAAAGRHAAEEWLEKKKSA